MTPYVPLFIIGATKDGQIRIDVGNWELAEIAKDPFYLSAIVLGLYDTILAKVPDQDQIPFQKEFLEVLTHLVEKKDMYDGYISQKTPQK